MLVDSIYLSMRKSIFCFVIVLAVIIQRTRRKEGGIVEGEIREGGFQVIRLKLIKETFHSATVPQWNSGSSAQPGQNPLVVHIETTIFYCTTVSFHSIWSILVGSNAFLSRKDKEDMVA